MNKSKYSCVVASIKSRCACLWIYNAKRLVFDPLNSIFSVSLY